MTWRYRVLFRPNYAQPHAFVFAAVFFPACMHVMCEQITSYTQKSKTNIQGHIKTPHLQTTPQEQITSFRSHFYREFFSEWKSCMAFFDFFFDRIYACIHHDMFISTTCVGCLVRRQFSPRGYFPQKSPIISGSFAKRNLQLKASYPKRDTSRRAPPGLKVKEGFFYRVAKMQRMP